MSLIPTIIICTTVVLCTAILAAAALVGWSTYLRQRYVDEPESEDETDARDMRKLNY